MIGCYEQHGEMMMCFVVAKDASKDGCVALRIAHGQALVNLKREIVGRIGYSHIQIMTISKPSAYGEYAPYRVVETEDEFKAVVYQMSIAAGNE